MSTDIEIVEADRPDETPEPETVAARIMRMRDDMILLVTAFNNAREFSEALDAQALVIALTKFEEDHDVTNAAWPPVADREDGGGGLRWVPNT